MTYASQEDIVDLYGEDLLVRLTDTTRSNAIDTVVVGRGLQSADDIINSYVSERYTLPLPMVPGVLRECGVDIAVYKIALSTTKKTPEMRQRYEDAIALLERIGSGKAGLGLIPGDDDPPIDSTPTRVGRSINLRRT